MTTPGAQRRNALVGVLLASSLALTAAACSTDPNAGSDGRLQVLTSFYPLEFISEQIGGAHVKVSNLTPSGGEPHDLELAPATVRRIDSADVIVYLNGFQPSIDNSVAQTNARLVIDVEPHAALEPYAQDDGHDDEDEDDDGHDHGPLDPHFWLDPVRLAKVTEHVGAQFAALDPDNATDYQFRTAALVADLNALDAAYVTGLEACESRTIVTSHAAFRYLAHKYELEQLSVTGLDPESEPAPARLRRISEKIAAENIGTVFYDSSASAKIAEVLARDLDVKAAVLDPLGTQLDLDSDYLAVMDQNLTALRTALVCN